MNDMRNEGQNKTHDKNQQGQHDPSQRPGQPGQNPQQPGQRHQDDPSHREHGEPQKKAS